MERRVQAVALVQWLTVGGLMGVVTGVTSFVFLRLLYLATDFRVHHEQVIYLLPVAGWVLGVVYERIGKPIQAGSNLIIDTIHDDGPEIPVRIAPVMLVGTVLTHVFGGSAGREGTAVQMGASLADALAHRVRWGRALRQHFLAAGVAGGFGSVFGTPIAGALFGLEFVVLGRIDYNALLPALVAALVGDMVTRGLGMVHETYPVVSHEPLTVLLLGKLLIFAAAVAATSSAFIEVTHGLKKLGARYLPRLPMRMLLGGAVVVLAWRLMGTSDYLGLGTPGILRAFVDLTQPTYAFVAKLLFTAVTLAAGFLGGEVTPLFFVGATLGNVLAQWLNIPLALGAGLGMAGVFASASNTPLALSIMAVELLGGSVFPHAAVVCVVAYVLGGHRSIYPAQRLARNKAGAVLPKATALRDMHTTE